VAPQRTNRTRVTQGLGESVGVASPRSGLESLDRLSPQNCSAFPRHTAQLRHGSEYSLTSEGILPAALTGAGIQWLKLADQEIW
jgi:hypothetical protein